MNRRAAAALLLSVMLMMCSCAPAVSHYDLWASFDCPDEMSVSETETTIRMADDTVTILITRKDASSYVSESASDWDREKLDIESGAFDGNFNNVLFVFEFFKYLAEEGSEISPPAEALLGEGDMHSFYCSFSGTGYFGYMYETVQDAVLYVIAIRVKDDVSGEELYRESIGTVTDSLRL